MVKKIVVFHEYGAKSHYVGLEEYATSINTRLVYREFNLLKQFLKLFFKRGSFKVFLKNICFLTTVLFSKNHIIILGMAPGDYRLFIYFLLLKRHIVFWHTSWVNQDVFKPLPKGLNNSSYKKKWYKTLNLLIRGVAIVNPFSLGPLKKLGFKNIVTVYHCISSPNKCDIKSKRNYDLGFIGRPEISKGYDLFKALSIKFKNLKFYQSGNIPPKELISQNIKNLGYLKKEELYLNLRDTKIVLNLSGYSEVWQEVFGITIVEAVVNGCYVICTKSPGSILLKKFYPNNIVISDMEYIENHIKILLNRENRKIDINFFNSKNICKRWERLLKK
jgi:hypothetical protein